MVNHLLETSHPLSSSTLRLCGSVAAQSFHSQYTLPSSVSHNPFVCHSYENTGVGGEFFPFWDAPTFRRSDLQTFRRFAVLSSALLPALQPRKRAGNDRA